VSMRRLSGETLTLGLLELIYCQKHNLNPNLFLTLTQIDFFIFSDL
jgi:hypothetical protein